MTDSNARAALERSVRHGFLHADYSEYHPYQPTLRSNEPDSSALEVLRGELEEAESFVFSVAFVTAGGIGTIKQQLAEFKGSGTIITADYLDFNSPDALRELLTLPEGIEPRIMQGIPHHAKGYIFQHSDHVTAMVGSSNLTRNALTSNTEWNLQFSTSGDGDIADQLREAVEWQVKHSVKLTEEWIAEYERRRKSRVILPNHGQPLERGPAGDVIRPNKMQTVALQELQRVVDNDERRALIISATGTGKTILAALAAKQLNPKRVLFVAHREQILRKAAEEFTRVLDLGSHQCGFYGGSRRDTDRDFTFATVQTLHQAKDLQRFSPRDFDLVLIDEVHRAGASSYRAILDYFEPQFALGLTATPERTDGFNVFELFDYNVPYEIRLEGALEAAMLVPFDYYGVTDYTTARSTVGARSSLALLTSDERVDHIVNTLGMYSFATGSKGLIFCSTNEEARKLSELLNTREVHGRRLRTRALSGADSTETRTAVTAQLEAGELDYLLTVDIFNEGIDIPPVNVVVLLRATESAIVFTQQLGRGLRKYEGKESLRVIDFIGNYANNYLIPIALTGEQSGDKDRVKRKLGRSRTKPVAGGSTVSFDRVSTKRVLESLQKARLDGMRAKREAIETLQHRLGHLPVLKDFRIHGLMDPPILAASRTPRNYWSLLHHHHFVEQGPSPAEAKVLSMLSVELLNGKRPQELLLLEQLLTDATLTRSAYASFLAERGLDASDAVLRSVEKLLDLTWFESRTRKRYGENPLVVRDGETYRLGERFADLYHSYSGEYTRQDRAENFRAHVDDIIDTGLKLNRERYNGADTLQVGETYSRKDACRLLNWPKNQESTVMGYRTDPTTGTCPIFVTYHKGADVAESQRYKDAFLNRSTMHWYSRSGNTLASSELQPIVRNEAELHLFVKREDADGIEFHYLGPVQAKEPENSTMPGKDDTRLDVVTTKLALSHAVPKGLYDAILASKLEASPDS